MNFRFQHIEMLAGLALVPLLLFLFLAVLRWKKKKSQQLGNAILVKQLTRQYSPQKYFLQFLLLLLAFISIVIALANPQIKGKSEKLQRKGVDIMVALDVSKSMLAQDIKPNRLDRAKQFINQLIQHSSSDRIGIVLFAGRAYVQMPLTNDHAAASMYLQSASPDAVPTQGTVIANALKMCANAFNTKDKRFKSIVLISDGEDHDPEALKVAQTLAENGVMINTVGIGSVEGTTIIDPQTNDFKKDMQGNNVITKLNEEELRQIATIAKGKYSLLIEPAATADAIRTQLSGIQQGTSDSIATINYTSYYYWFIALAILFLLAEIFIPEVKKTLA